MKTSEVVIGDVLCSNDTRDNGMRYIPLDTRTWIVDRRDFMSRSVHINHGRINASGAGIPVVMFRLKPKDRERSVRIIAAAKRIAGMIRSTGDDRADEAWANRNFSKYRGRRPKTATLSIVAARHLARVDDMIPEWEKAAERDRMVNMQRQEENRRWSALRSLAESNGIEARLVSPAPKDHRVMVSLDDFERLLNRR